MPDPARPQQDTRLEPGREPAVTGVMNKADLNLESMDDEYDLPMGPDEVAYRKEPLFNKRVMVTWAALTLGAWIFLKLIVPVAVDSARTAIVQSAKEAQSRKGNPGSGRGIRIERNGNSIVITTDELKPPPAAAVPAPAAPVSEAAPVTAPEPATAKRTTTPRR
jgi:hypothetical protein